jgi:hypothetical protein
MANSEQRLSDEELLARATRAYFVAARKHGGAVNQPGSHDSTVETDSREKAYVVLRNVNGVLAVYRIRNDGVLKGLKRWPKEIESPEDKPVPKKSPEKRAK